MTKGKPEFKKDVAFINREKELNYLRDYINIRPESLLFIHGPKSSGKTTLLYKFFDKIQKKQELGVKFLGKERDRLHLTIYLLPGLYPLFTIQYIQGFSTAVFLVRTSSASLFFYRHYF